MGESGKVKRAEAGAGIAPDSPQAFLNRELSWLNFARRVLHQVGRKDLPLLERVKFAGIMGTIHDEFFVKRVGGLKRQAEKGDGRPGPDGRTPQEVLTACRAVLLEQSRILEDAITNSLLPALRKAGVPVLDYAGLDDAQQAYLRKYFRKQVAPLLTPLAVDDEHPFPFVSSNTLNLAVQLKEQQQAGKRFIRLKVPDNRPRWVELPDGGYVPLEQVIAGNLAQLFPGAEAITHYFFRVTRGMEGPQDAAQLEQQELTDSLEMPAAPGSLLALVSGSLKARRFAGVTRLQVSAGMPQKMQAWLAQQLGVTAHDTYVSTALMNMRDLLSLRPAGRPELCEEPHAPMAHPRLAALAAEDPGAIFAEIRRGDILLHHPYHSFDTSVLRFLQGAAADPQVLALKLTIYRTSRDSPIIRALVEAARRGKQVAVLVELTARFDEAPNIAWARLLEREGVHVAYGVQQLKTHVKLALVVREEGGAVRRYTHIGTGNYHTGTARLYEDLGLLTCDAAVGEDSAAVFNNLTGAVNGGGYQKLLVAPDNMLARFLDLIAREAEHARAGRPSGIYAKLNQLQDPEIIRALYAASAAGVPITLNVRGLCCLRAGAAGLSEHIRVYSVVGRFLEHSRLYRFTNGGEAEYFIGSADWMQRNLRRRVETTVPVEDPMLRRELDAIIAVYESDNCSAWDMQADGSYTLRSPKKGKKKQCAQLRFIELTKKNPGGTGPPG